MVSLLKLLGLEDDRIISSTNPLKYIQYQTSLFEKSSSFDGKGGFTKSPHYPFRTSRIDDLASFAVLGLDIKITPRGEVKIIEVNGLKSGMDGFKRASVQYEGAPSLEGLLALPYLSHTKWKYPRGNNTCEEALTMHINGLGKIPIAYIAARLAVAGLDPFRLGSIETIAGTPLRGIPSYLSLGTQWEIYDLCEMALRNAHYEFDFKYGNIAETLIGIERLLKDKLRCDMLFDECRGIKPKTYAYTESNFQRLVLTEHPRFVVLKPQEGARGEGLVIVPAHALPGTRPLPGRGLVAESFVHSKPILSVMDLQFHDGCMRYVLFVEEEKCGQVNLHHFGGYWRLCPHPQSEYLDLDGMRANLSQGAMAEKASPEDLSAVRNILDKEIPIFYRNLIQRTNPEKVLEQLLQNSGQG